MLLVHFSTVPVLLRVAAVWQVIFHHYVKDLEAVQAQYEAFKHKPPVARNMPPIAGNIMWSRQLLRRIEEPMQHFAQNKALMAMKESKKVIKMYNRVSYSCSGAIWHARLLSRLDFACFNLAGVCRCVASAAQHACVNSRFTLIL
jgi:hypothetical protein